MYFFTNCPALSSTLCILRRLHQVSRGVVASGIERFIMIGDMIHSELRIHLRTADFAFSTSANSRVLVPVATPIFRILALVVLGLEEVSGCGGNQRARSTLPFPVISKSAAVVAASAVGASPQDQVKCIITGFSRCPGGIAPHLPKEGKRDGPLVLHIRRHGSARGLL